MKKLRKLRVEAIIFVGGMNKNYVGYSLQVEYNLILIPM